VLRFGSAVDWEHRVISDFWLCINQRSDLIFNYAPGTSAGVLHLFLSFSLKLRGAHSAFCKGLPEQLITYNHANSSEVSQLTRVKWCFIKKRNEQNSTSLDMNRCGVLLELWCSCWRICTGFVGAVVLMYCRWCGLSNDRIHVLLTTRMWQKKMTVCDHVCQCFRSAVPLSCFKLDNENYIIILYSIILYKKKMTLL